MRIPGPRGHWLLGNVREFGADKLAFLSHCSEVYGDVFGFRLGNLRLVVVNDLDQVKRLLIDDAGKYQKAKITRDIFRRVLGDGLMVAEGDLHRRQRRLAQPAFDAKRLRSYGSLAVRHARAAAERWSGSSEIDMALEMTRVSQNAQAEALFGEAVDADTETLTAAIAELQEAAGALFNSAFVPPAWLPTPKNRMLKRATAVVDAVLARVIDGRRKHFTDRGDLLSILLSARGEDGAPMSPRQVRDEAVTLFLSGMDATANALSWTWYHLAKNPDVASRLERETRHLRGRVPEVADLDSLPYVTMVLKESLRRTPPVWAFNRSPIASDSIGNWPIAPSDVVIISPYLLHHDARSFPEPERFDPERFAPEREATIPRLAFLPYGAGPRICIGARLANLQAGLVIATLASRFRLTLPAGYDVEQDVQVSIRPKNGLRMLVHALAEAPQ